MPISWGWEGTGEEEYGYERRDGYDSFEQETIYYHQNHRGDVVSLTSEDGRLLESVRYSAYGVPDVTRFHPCNIVDDQGNPLFHGTPVHVDVPDGGVNEADYNAFFIGYFAAEPWCDIADDTGVPRWFGHTKLGTNNGGVNEGDWNCFYQHYFAAPNRLRTIAAGDLEWGELSFPDRQPTPVSVPALPETGNRIGYAGYWWDDHLQMYYVRNRWYMPRTGRWLTPDPIGRAGGLNLFEYCDGKPTNHVDPLGLQPGMSFPGMSYPLSSYSGMAEAQLRGQQYQEMAYRQAQQRAVNAAATAAAVAAAEARHPYAESGPWGTFGSQVFTRTMGVVQAAVGGATMVAGAATSSVGIGIPLLAWGADQTQAGVRTYATGEAAGTIGGTVIAAGLEEVGVPPWLAEPIAEGGYGMVGPLLLTKAPVVAKVVAETGEGAVKGGAGAATEVTATVVPKAKHVENVGNGVKVPCTDCVENTLTTHAKGVAAEEAVANKLGIRRNAGPGRETVPGTGPGGYRLPDFPPSVTLKELGTVVEVKDLAGTLKTTDQLRDLLNYAQANNATLTIYTNASLPKTGWLARHILDEKIIIKPLP